MTTCPDLAVHTARQSTRKRGASALGAILWIVSLCGAAWAADITTDTRIDDANVGEYANAPIAVAADATLTIALAPTTAEQVFAGAVSGAGKIVVENTGAKAVRFKGSFKDFTGEFSASGDVRIGSTWENINLNGRLSGISVEGAGNKVAKFFGANVLGEHGAPISIGHQAYPKSTLDLNGFDQAVSTLTFMGSAYDPETSTSSYITPNYTLKSDTAATLMLGSLSWATAGGLYPIDHSGTVGVNGALSLVYAGTSAEPFAFHGPSTTKGGISIRSGGVIIASDATFDNLTSLAVSGTGSLTLQTTSVNSQNLALEIADSGTVTLPEVSVFRVKSLKVDGVSLAPDTYDADMIATLTDSRLTGAAVEVLSREIGETKTFTWIGGGTDDSLATAANWQGGAAPTLMGGDEILVFASGTSATVPAGTDVYGLEIATADVLHGDWTPDPERPGTFMTHTPGASLKFSFAGSVLRLRMCYQPDGGIMSAKIDGKPIADVVGFDQYSTYVRGGSVTLYDGADGIHEVELTLTDREPDRTILSRQLKEPAKELAAPKYHGTVFRVSQLMIISDLLGERTLTVSPDGLSPQQALETIRAAKKGGDTSAWTVDVKPGLYTLREPLTFTPEDSGTAAAPVTWRGAGEASEISGGAPLAKLSRLIVVKGEPDKGRYVDHIRFEGLAFTASDATPIEGGKGPLTYYPGQAVRAFDALLDATGARNFALTGCFVRHTGNIGIRLRDGCFSNRVTRCVFSDLGAGGVWFGADAVRLAKDEKYPVGRREIFGYHPRANAFNVLEDCIIRDGGRYNAMGTGVVIGHASDCRVAHCEISDFFYSGVSVGWQWAYLPTAAMRNVVRFNRIHDLGKGVLSDMGGVYTLGTSFGTRVTDNVIYNVSSRTYGGWGLNADEGSEGIVFARNLVYNTHDGGFHQHYGAGNTVQNNIFAWNEQNGVIRTVRANVFNVRSSLNVVANIVLTDRGDLASAGVRGVEGVWANNLWFDPNGEAKLDGLTWEKWRACGKEVNGRYADPKFVDARNFDFRLKPDSPTFALGFQPFDYTRAGVRGSTTE